MTCPAIDPTSAHRRRRHRTSHAMHEPVDYPRHPAPFTSRTVLAAAHVVADVRADYTPGIAPPVDWEATIAFRRHLFSYGIGIAEAMDTTERGPGGLDWSQAQGAHPARCRRGPRGGRGGRRRCRHRPADGPARPWIARSSTPTPSSWSSSRPGSAGRDPGQPRAGRGGAQSEDDYLEVYRGVLAMPTSPAIVHWLGTGFDPTLERLLGPHRPDGGDGRRRGDGPGERRARLDGIKFSLLDEELEKEFRRRLPGGRQGVHRRRLRLHRPAAAATASTTATGCSACSTRSRRSPRPLSRRWTRGRGRVRRT